MLEAKYPRRYSHDRLGRMLTRYSVQSLSPADEGRQISHDVLIDTSKT